MQINLGKVLLAILVLVSFDAAAPMEPAKSTLFILLDGMKPSNKGLLQDYCVGYESDETWGKTGAAKFFQEKIINTKSNLYSRSYKNPADAPSAMVSELAGHGNKIETINCIEKKQVYVASSNNFLMMDGDKMKLSSIIDEALEHWYVSVLNEMALPLPMSSSASINNQKNRNAWAGIDGNFSPMEEYTANFSNVDIYLYAWLNDYRKQNGSYPTLQTLKNERPDFLPLRYVFIADGMGGMVAREYIQGEGYQDDVDKILFINTPHEGTGFADQALLSKDIVYNAHSTLGATVGALVPLMTLLYVGSNYFVKDSIISFSKTLLQTLAGFENITINGNINTHFFYDYNIFDGALWYLAQDADKRDASYANLINNAQEWNVDTLIGRTQLINSFGMKTAYSDPMYRLMYSYGMPSVGNGRRALADYLFQKKTHISKEQLNQEIIKTLEAGVSGILVDSLKVPKEIADNYAKQIYLALRKKYSDDNAFVKFLAGKGDGEKYVEMLKEKGVDVERANAEAAAYVSSDIADWAINLALEEGMTALTNAVVGWFDGLLLDWIDLKSIIENLDEDVVSVISVLLEIVPQNYHEKIVSAFISSYSPSYKDMDIASDECSLGTYKSIFPSDWYDFAKNVFTSAFGDYGYREKCMATGQETLAKSLINYSINFYDQGTYDVPVYSAFGGSVSLFNEKDVKRYSYPLHTLPVEQIDYQDMMSEKKDDFDNLRDELVQIGFLEANRKTIDELLGYTCQGVEAALGSAYKMGCDAMRYTTNILMLLTQVADLTEIYDEYHILNQTKDMALKHSLGESHVSEIELYSGQKRSISYSDMDEMLYENPYVSLQMIPAKIDGENKAIPLMLKKKSSDSYNDIPEIVDFEQFKAVYTPRLLEETDGADGIDFNKVYIPIDYEDLKTIALKSNVDYYKMSLREMTFKKWENGSITRQIIRKEIPAIVVDDEIMEYRFQVEDLRPDLIWQIKIDMNLDVQYYFERDTDGKWDIYVERNGKNKVLVEEKSEISPVNEMGLFVFRPMDLAMKANAKINNDDDKIASNKIQPEGPNLVSISVTNYLNMSSSEQFSFYYRSTLPYFREGWPEYLQEVSLLDDVYITINNLGDPYTLIDAEVCLLKSEDGKYIQVPNSCTIATITPEEKTQVNEADWSTSWKALAHLGDNFLSNNGIVEGEYILQWHLKTKNDGSSTITNYNMNVTIFVDSQPPVLSLDVLNTNLSNTSRDGVWGKISNKDASSLRATRIFAVFNKEAGEKDTVWIRRIYGTGVSEISFGWNEALGKVSQGKCSLYVQSVDYAEPNALIGGSLYRLYSEKEEDAKKAWSEILELNGVDFKKGVNGVTLSTELFVDREAPSIAENSVVISAEADTSMLCKECPQWNRVSSSDVIVNSSEQLKILFSLKNVETEVKHDSVRIQLIFTDTDQSFVKSVVAVHDFKDKSTFTFHEPSQSMIPDGVYAVSAVLTDEAGNSSGIIDLNKKVRIDRSKPIINNVVAGEPVYASSAEVDAATYTVSSSKIAGNNSAFTCYQKLSTENESSNWSYIGRIEAESLKNKKKVTSAYSIKQAGLTIADGRYSTTVGCYDESGNFSKNASPFSVGFRFPVLTYPTSTTSSISDDYVQIVGIAPNPVVPGGNIQTSEYKVEWRKEGDDDWKTDNIQVTGKTVSNLEDNLAIWDRRFVPAGNYEVRLSVRGCSDDAESKCEWVSTIEKVNLADVDVRAASEKPSIVLFTSLDSLIPGEKTESISAQMRGVTDGSKWSMEMKILVPNPYDSSQMVVAKKAYLDSMIISPFGGAPDKPLPEGLSIWQENDEWVISYVGKADAAEYYSQPELILRYTHSAVEFTSPNTADNEAFVYNDTAQFVPKMDFVYAISPAYNYSSVWNLSGKSNFEIKFKTTKPFVLDASSIKNAGVNMYCGKTAEYCSTFFPLLNDNFATLFVNTSDFKMDLSWNGLTANGLIPGSGTAKVIALATEKGRGTRVVMDTLDLDLHLGDLRIESDYSHEGQLIISSEETENSVIRLGEVGYEFGIFGRNARVTVVVKDPEGKVVKTLMKDEECIAGSRRNAKSVSWNGVSEKGFASIKAGRYHFEITAIDDDEHEAKKEYYFNVVYAGRLLVAPESENQGDVSAILKMDEAKLDENGELRFIGKPDYLVTADVSAQYLATQDRELKYYWDWKGIQYPVFYRANRFSLGIRRQRKSFPVTVVTMMSSLQYYLNWTTNWERENECDKYKIRVDSVWFDMETGGVFEISNFNLEGGKNHIIGYDAYPPVYHPINFKAKVFKIDDYRKIVNRLGANQVTMCIEEKTTDSRKEDFDKNYSDIGAVKLWSFDTTFKYNSDEIDYKKGSENVTKGCITSEENDYVCDMDANKDLNRDFNPHANMLMVSIKHIDGKDKFGNTSYSCLACRNDKSADELYAKILYKVDSNYWNPVFGYSNLANKYVRFDHTNKTLYKPASGESLGGLYTTCKAIQNYYDGEKWTHSNYYGMVTPFEVQRFAYKSEKDYCPGQNPLQFSDETIPTIPSKYEFGFMGVDNEDRYDEEKYKPKLDFVAQAFGSANGVVVSQMISGKSDIVSLGSSIGDPWLDPTVDFYVTTSARASQAIRQRNDVFVAYPYVGEEYKPVKFGDDELCDIYNPTKIQRIDDQDKHCFVYYPAASRIHYNVDDWFDDDWREHFGNPNDSGIINNPLYAKTLLSKENGSLDLKSEWKGVNSEPIYKTEPVEFYDAEKGVWKITYNKIKTEDILETQMYDIRPQNIKKQLAISPESKAGGWSIGEDGESVVNFGDEVKGKIEYNRAGDETPWDLDKYQPFAKEVITKERIEKQNKSNFILNNEWVQGHEFSNVKIIDKKTAEEHAYFTVSVLENSKKDLLVSRNGLVPQGRVEEIVTLRGQAPDVGMRWTLSYLNGARMVPLASGIQEAVKLEDPYPLLNRFDVNTLQGNTSFFLTYGSNDAAGDIFVKQLDVHIGELLKPTDNKTIEAMYGNVSVHFPANAFETDVDVTVRVADLSEFDGVFQGLYPVGTVIEVLPSHVFKQDGTIDTRPWVSIEVTKESLGNQNPLDVRIYKPDAKRKEVVPLESQEMAFYNNDGELAKCNVSNGLQCTAPNGWTKIVITGKTSTFSTFMLMDKEKAALVKPVDKSDIVVSEFACNLDKMPSDTTIWAGLVNGYLEYPYPCVGRSNYMLQLLRGHDAVAEFQGVADSDIVIATRKNDFLVNVNAADMFESRLALYGTNGKNLQIAGPTILPDTSLPVIEDAIIVVEDQDLQKHLTLHAELADAESGIATVKLDLYWAGKLVESRVKGAGSNLIEDFFLTKKTIGECSGCNAEIVLTAYDFGHNYVKASLLSEEIYPFPKSLVLWYPLSDGAGYIAKEAMGTGLDLNLSSMYKPWRYGSSLYFGKITDVANPLNNWDGVGNVSMSVEFRMRSDVSKSGTEHSIIGWNGAKRWQIGLKDANSLFFEYDGERTLFDRAQVNRGVESHFVFTIEGRDIYLYKDGEIIEQKVLSTEFTWTTNGKVVVGANANYPSIGAGISAIRLYQAGLTAEEVRDLFYGEVDVVESKLQVVRAVDILNRDNLAVDQSCELAGMAYLRQKMAGSQGSVTWEVTTDAGRYSLYLFARGYEKAASAVEIMIDEVSAGTFNLNGSGIWTSQILEGLVLRLLSGTHKITIKPIGYAGLAAFAIANAESKMSASMLAWNEKEWLVPEPKIQVEMAYPSYSDKTWLRANFRLKNTSNENLEGVRLRYYYRGEDYFVHAKSFYPYTEMSIQADAADVFYAELELNEVIPVGGSPYYGNGPQIGAYRTSNNAPWNFDDDPSFDKAAIDGQFHLTDKVALLDGEGNLISRFACFDGTDPMEPKTPEVRALAMEESGYSANVRTIAMMVENVGVVPIHGFEVRYFVRENVIPEFDVYSNQFAETPKMVAVDGDLYYVSFRYNNVILNPGEKSDYGNGVKFALRHMDGSDWDSSNDPSFYGLSYNFVQADSIVILDLNGNILWGKSPRPTNALPEILGSSNYGDFVVVDPDGIFIEIPEDGNYVLERINAEGVSQELIFSGKWSIGEHFISTDNVNLVSGQYLVLRRGTTILARVLIR